MERKSLGRMKIERYELHKHCADNNIEGVKQSLDAGLHYNGKCPNLSTPLHWAVYSGNEEIVELLKDPDIVPDSDGITPLHLAVLANNISLVRHLLGRMKEDSPDKQGVSATHLAAYCGFNDILKLLVDWQFDNCDIDNVTLKDDNGIVPLHLAAARNNYPAVKFLLERGATIDSPDSCDRYPVSWAATCGNVEMIRELLFTSSPVPFFDGNSPLFLATKYGHYDATKYLLERKCSLGLISGIDYHPVKKFSNGISFDEFLKDNIEVLGRLPNALHWAAAFCSVEIIKQFSVSLEELDPLGNSLLHTAAAFGNYNMVQYLVNQRFEIDLRCEDNCTPMNWAASFGHLDVVKLLNRSLASLSGSLSWAAAYGQLDVMEYLLKYNANIDERDTVRSYTPVVWAAEMEESDAVIKLIDHCPKLINLRLLKSCVLKELVGVIEHMISNYRLNINQADSIGPLRATVLHIAAHIGNVNMVKYLLSKGADPNKSAAMGFRPIHFAVAPEHNIEVIQVLIQNGACVNCWTSEGKTPLLYACLQDKIEIVKFLINNGADVNPAVPDIDTPLNKSLIMKNYEISKLLIENGANVNINTGKSVSPLIYSIIENQTELFKTICEQDVDFERTDPEWQTALFYAARHNNLHFLNVLVTKFVNLNHKDKREMTALHDAIKCNKTAVAKLLIQIGADVNTKTKFNETPLSEAARLGNLDVMKLLIAYGADVLNLDPNILQHCDVSEDKLNRIRKAGLNLPTMKSQWTFVTVN